MKNYGIAIKREGYSENVSTAEAVTAEDCQMTQDEARAEAEHVAGNRNEKVALVRWGNFTNGERAMIVEWVYPA